MATKARNQRMIGWDSFLENPDDCIFEMATWLSSQISDSAARERYTELVNTRAVATLAVLDNEVLGTPYDTYLVRQILAFFQKRDDIELPGVDRRATALAKFEASERLCRETNMLLRMQRAGSFFMESAVQSVLHRAARKISFVLGDLPDVSQLPLRFGPGATTNIRKMEAHPRYKLGAAPACSEELVPALDRVVNDALPGWFEKIATSADSVGVEVHPGKIALVPKNAKTDRTICVEPVLNSMLQLGYGQVIADRLRVRAGQDITDQTRNQRLARLGSIAGSLATLDLSSASDTIATELVFELLPLDWAFALSECRTGLVSIQGETPMRLEKFSSMGNGFTFPLETLIFYALASSCVDDSRLGEVSVYGDDIIVPTEAVPLLTRVLTACGFLLNKEKSFSEGPFRESCGKDYYHGIDVRPVYIKGALKYCDLYILHNFFVERYEDELAAIILSHIPEFIRLWGPSGYGDGHLHSRTWERSKPHRSEDGWSGTVFDTFTYKKRRSYKPSPGDGVLPLYTIYSRNYGGVPWAEDTLTRDVMRESPRVIESAPVTYKTVGGERELLGVVIPGTRGYKRISVYTLAH